MQSQDNGRGVNFGEIRTGEEETRGHLRFLALRCHTHELAIFTTDLKFDDIFTCCVGNGFSATS